MQGLVNSDWGSVDRDKKMGREKELEFNSALIS